MKKLIKKQEKVNPFKLMQHDGNNLSWQNFWLNNEN